VKDDLERQVEVAACIEENVRLCVVCEGELRLAKELCASQVRELAEGEGAGCEGKYKEGVDVIFGGRPLR